VESAEPPALHLLLKFCVQNIYHTYALMGSAFKDLINVPLVEIALVAYHDVGTRPALLGKKNVQTIQ